MFPATRALEGRTEMSAEVADVMRQPRPSGEGRGSPDLLGVKRRGWWLARGADILGMDQYFFDYKSFIHPMTIC